jgi:hypothetical protein
MFKKRKIFSVPVMIIVIAMISSRSKKAANKTNSEAALYARIISGFPGIVIGTDGDLRIVATNQGFLREFQLMASDLSGQLKSCQA